MKDRRLADRRQSIPKIACPYPGCACAESKVVNSRTLGNTYRRRRVCLQCLRRFTTTEQVIGRYTPQSSTHYNI